MAWTVYIVRSASDKLYTGITTDMERRLAQHRGEARGGARFFRTARADAVVYREIHADRSSATRRELEIKSMRRAEKLALVAGA